MNCQNHPEIAATAYCRTCGKPVCEECRRDAFGTVYCAEHVPAPAAAGPAPGGRAVSGFSPPARSAYRLPEISPGLAFFLGWIPGVGAIYNGQYAKGLVHAVIWGDPDDHRQFQRGTRDGAGFRHADLRLDVLHGLRGLSHGAEAAGGRSRWTNTPASSTCAAHNAPAAGIALMLLGVLLLLHTLDLFDFERVVRYWPVLLIAAGVYLLYGRFVGGGAQEEARHERR